ncbi:MULTISPECIES: hypothetical protein [unclassified Shinella]|uniref:hypothetical protein n=1 Tax=unclassified Shinella TaxID=2643062 RepID=UPI00234F7BB3|nr:MULTISPECIES: hypothetical protein [unclassified Shinella]MCO5153388.1 hypothetical protein [Shinella sp.]MDC7260567.1 hypothetical protein [Shinella sp. HY16]MDC7267462.1 hypothetical protein [Shinella sp. YZ44]
MPSPVNSRRFGLYPSLGNRGRFPVDPAKSGGSSLKFIGVTSVPSNQSLASLNVGPAASNRTLVFVFSAFYNNSGPQISSWLIDGVPIDYVDGSFAQAGQSVICGIGYVKKEAKSNVKLDMTLAGTVGGAVIAVYQLFTPNPKPSIIKQFNAGTTGSIILGKGSVGVFTSGTGDIAQVDSIKNGIIDYDNSASTLRISPIGRVVRPSLPLILTADRTAQFKMTAVAWD